MKLVVLLSFALLLVACGPPRNAPVYRPGELRNASQFESPFWIAFEPGDDLPLYVDVDGPFFALKPKKPLTIHIKERFYVLIGDGMPRLSRDRETFFDGGGSFRFGIGNSKKRGPHAEVVLRHGQQPPP